MTSVVRWHFHRVAMASKTHLAALSQLGPCNSVPNSLLSQKYLPMACTTLRYLFFFCESCCSTCFPVKQVGGDLKLQHRPYKVESLPFRWHQRKISN